MRAIATPRPYRRAKIIPFPVQNQINTKPSGDTRWLLWAALFVAVSIGGEIVSSHLDAQGISPISISKTQNGKPAGHINN
jgi:hypothetical protein